MRTFGLTTLALLLVAAQASNPTTKPATPTQLAFERFKSLQGTWEGRSTKGWVERIAFKTIAGGSCVMETSFDSHPNETMVTMFHMDGPTLILTHYCVAKNQPRLRASEINADASVVKFTFVDGGNLPSRDRGHMDQAIFKFDGTNRMSTQWTWYQNGKEQWMEEIILTRTDDSSLPTTAPADPVR